MATTPIVRPEEQSPEVNEYDTFSAAGEAHRLLVRDGLGKVDYQAAINDRQFRLELIRFWKARGSQNVHAVEPSQAQMRAREIMGSNFLTVDDVERHFRVRFTAEQLAELGDIPWSEEVLEECKDTHVLFPGFPLTILEVRKRAKKKGVKLFYSDRDTWYNDQKFAREEKVGLRWHLIRKDIVENSTNKSYDEQLALLSENEEAAQAAAVVYMIILYFLVTGIRLFERIYARCQDVTSSGGRVCVGSFDRGGLHVYSDWGDGRDVIIGLASSRK